jgi:hypothetical protein
MRATHREPGRHRVQTTARQQRLALRQLARQTGDKRSVVSRQEPSAHRCQRRPAQVAEGGQRVQKARLASAHLTNDEARPPARRALYEREHALQQLVEQQRRRLRRPRCATGAGGRRHGRAVGARAATRCHSRGLSHQTSETSARCEASARHGTPGSHRDARCGCRSSARLHSLSQLKPRNLNLAVRRADRRALRPRRAPSCASAQQAPQRQLPRTAAPCASSSNAHLKSEAPSISFNNVPRQRPVLQQRDAPHGGRLHRARRSAGRAAQEGRREVPYASTA